MEALKRQEDSKTKLMGIAALNVVTAPKIKQNLAKKEQNKRNNVTPPKFLSPRAARQTKLTFDTEREYSMENLEKTFMTNRIRRDRYDPEFVSDENRLSIVALLTY